MSDFLRYFENSSDSEFISTEKFSKEPKKAASNDKVILALKIIFLLLLLCGVAEFFIYKFFMPCMRSPVVSVSGQKSYTAEDIVDLLRPMNAKSWFEFDVNSAMSIIASDSRIDSVVIKKSFPNKIYISVVEREPVATTFINSEDTSIAFEIDKNGVIFPERNRGQKKDASIPIVSGIPVEHLSEGMRIPLKYRALIEQISSLPKNYFAAISEICVTPKEYGNYELVLIPSTTQIRVLVDRILNEEALKYMMVVLDVVTANEPNVYEIDLRYGSVLYRKR